MIGYETAIEKILDHVKPCSNSETMLIAQAVGKISGGDVVCDCLVSPFDNSAMDGFAFKYSDLQNGVTKFKVVGSTFAGDNAGGVNVANASNNANDASGAWEIMTGAAIPFGYDCVVKIEDINISKTGDNGKPILIALKTSPINVPYNNNIRRAGQDFKPGDIVVAKNKIVNNAHITALATIGVADISVMQAPKIAIISTGKEIIDDPKQILKAGQIRNSNGPSLTSNFLDIGLSTHYGGTIKDDVTDYKKVINELCNKFDVIISTGAVSMGRHDFIPQSLRELGAEIVFHKSKIRPGKPIIFAVLKANENRKKPVYYFGLPGNPVSANIGFRFFIMPLINKWMGRAQETSTKAVLQADITKKHDFKMFYKAYAEHVDGQLQLHILQGQESFKIKPLTEANCWAVFAETQYITKKGALVDIFPMQPDKWQFQ